MGSNSVMVSSLIIADLDCEQDGYNIGKKAKEV